MFSLYNTVLICSSCVFFSLFLGLLVSFTVPLGKSLKQITGLVMEFSSGFTVAIVFLNIIPFAYSYLKVLELIILLLLGVLILMLTQEKLKYRYNSMSDDLRLSSTLRLICISFALTSVLKGVSVGTGLGHSLGFGIDFVISFAICIFPDSLAIFMLNKTLKKTVFRRLVSCCALAVPVLIGSFFGAYLGHFNEIIFSRILVLIGGVSLYLAVGEISIESKHLYKGRLIPICNIAGMILGVTTVLFG